MRLVEDDAEPREREQVVGVGAAAGRLGLEGLAGRQVRVAELLRQPGALRRLAGARPAQHGDERAALVDHASSDSESGEDFLGRVGADLFEDDATPRRRPTRRGWTPGFHDVVDRGVDRFELGQPDDDHAGERERVGGEAGHLLRAKSE